MKDKISAEFSSTVHVLSRGLAISSESVAFLVSMCQKSVEIMMNKSGFFFSTKSVNTVFAFAPSVTRGGEVIVMLNRMVLLSDHK